MRANLRRAISRMVIRVLSIWIGIVSISHYDSLLANSCAKKMLLLATKVAAGRDESTLLQLTGKALNENRDAPIELSDSEVAALQNLSVEILNRTFVLKTKFLIPTGLMWIGMGPRGRVRFFRARLRQLGVESDFEEVFKAPKDQIVSVLQSFENSNKAELDAARVRLLAGKRPRIFRKALRQVVQYYGALPVNAIDVMAEVYGVPVDDLAYLENTGGGIAGVIRSTAKWGGIAAALLGAGYFGVNYAADHHYLPDSVPHQIDHFLSAASEKASDAASDMLDQGRAQINRISLDRDR